MVGMEVRDQNDVDLLRRIACAAQAVRQVPERSTAIPSASARIDEDQLLTSVDQEGCNGGIQQVRIFVQCPYDTIHRRSFSVEPVQIEYGSAIEQRCHFKIADVQSEKARHLIMMLRCGSQSGG